MIDTTREVVFPLAKALQFIPGKPNLSTLYRWCYKGVKGVRLETVCIGGARKTSREALERFFQATTQAADALLVSPATAAKNASNAGRRQAVESELSRRGY
jgi:hypothetical protein